MLGSHHQLGETTSASKAEALLNTCAKRSSGDAVKLVVDAASSDDAAGAAPNEKGAAAGAGVPCTAAAAGALDAARDVAHHR